MELVEAIRLIRSIRLQMDFLFLENFAKKTQCCRLVVQIKHGFKSDEEFSMSKGF